MNEQKECRHGYKHPKCLDCRSKSVKGKRVLTDFEMEYINFYVQVGDAIYIRGYGTYVVSWSRLPRGFRDLFVFSIVNTETGHTFADSVVSTSNTSIDLRELLGHPENRRVTFNGSEGRKIAGCYSLTRLYTLSYVNSNHAQINFEITRKESK